MTVRRSHVPAGFGKIPLTRPAILLQKRYDAVGIAVNRYIRRIDDPRSAARGMLALRALGTSASGRLGRAIERRGSTSSGHCGLRPWTPPLGGIADLYAPDFCTA